jgi:opacity protein-like surface antigen
MPRLLLTGLLVLTSALAHADDALFYVGAGISRNKLSEITNSNLSFADIDHTSWKALAGVRPLSFLGVEADYLDLGSGSGSLFQPGSGGPSSTHSDAKAFAAFAVGFLPVPVPFLDLYAKAGLSRWKLAGDTTTPGFAGLFAFSRNGTAFAWGAGAQVHFGAIGARLEYENFNISNTNGAQVISLDAMLLF